jgi:hypothetical protein
MESVYLHNSFLIVKYLIYKLYRQYKTKMISDNYLSLDNYINIFIFCALL